MQFLSALAFILGRCPHCGYVGCADSLSAPEGRAPRAAVAGLLESRACRFNCSVDIRLAGHRGGPQQVIGRRLRQVTNFS